MTWNRDWWYRWLGLCLIALSIGCDRPSVPRRPLVDIPLCDNDKCEVTAEQLVTEKQDEFQTDCEASVAVAIARHSVSGGNVPNPSPNPSPGGQCDNCDGTGKVGDGRVFVPCPECDGTGKKKTSDVNPYEDQTRKTAQPITLASFRGNEAIAVLTASESSPPPERKWLKEILSLIETLQDRVAENEKRIQKLEDDFMRTRLVEPAKEEVKPKAPPKPEKSVVASESSGTIVMHKGGDDRACIHCDRWIANEKAKLESVGWVVIIQNDASMSESIPYFDIQVKGRVAKRVIGYLSMSGLRNALGL